MWTNDFGNVILVVVSEEYSGLTFGRGIIPRQLERSDSSWGRAGKEIETDLAHLKILIKFYTNGIFYSNISVIRSEYCDVFFVLLIAIFYSVVKEICSFFDLHLLLYNIIFRALTRFRPNDISLLEQIWKASSIRNFVSSPSFFACRRSWRRSFSFRLYSRSLLFSLIRTVFFEIPSISHFFLVSFNT